MTARSFQSAILYLLIHQAIEQNAILYETSIIIDMIELAYIVSIEMLIKPVIKFAWSIDTRRISDRLTSSGTQREDRQLTTRNKANPFLLIADNNGGTARLSFDLPFSSSSGKYHNWMTRYPSKKRVLNAATQMT